MAIRFGNGFGIGASNNGGGGSLSFFTNISAIASYLSGFMSDFRNPDFNEYGLDGNDGHYINDGGGDMYDDGNATSPWLISNATYTGSSAYNSIQDYPFSVDYSNNGVGTINTSFGYVSLGYSGPSLLPLTVIGTRATIASPGTPIGFQCGGNIGADGGGTFVEGNIYTGNTVSGFTVHSYYRETYDAGDPSVCDVFILLGHPDWNSVFGDVFYGGDPSNQSCGSFLYTTGNGAQNILAIKTLLSKPNGSNEVTFSEVNTVVDNFILRIKEAKENILITPTPTPTMTPTPSGVPLTQFSPNGTNGPNGLITWLDYTTGINASNNLIDQSPFYNDFSYTGANPYTNGVTGYTFTGAGSYASALSVTQYNQIVNSFTIEMWVKIPSIPGTMSLLAAGGNSSGGWALRVDGSGNQLNFVKYNVADQTVNLPFTLQSNTWYHIVAAQGGTSLTYMINGEIVGASNSGANNNLSIPNGTVNVAKDFYTTTNVALVLGSLKVYDNCRSSADILSAFEASKAGYGFAGTTPTPTPTNTMTPTMTPSPSAALHPYSYQVISNTNTLGNFVGDGLGLACEAVECLTSMNCSTVSDPTLYFNNQTPGVGDYVYSGDNINNTAQLTDGYYIINDGNFGFTLVEIVSDQIVSLPACVTPTPTMTPSPTGTPVPPTPTPTMTPSPSTQYMVPLEIGIIPEIDYIIFDGVTYSASTIVNVVKGQAYSISTGDGSFFNYAGTGLAPFTPNASSIAITVTGSTAFVQAITNTPPTPTPSITPSMTPTMTMTPSLTPSATMDVTPTMTPSLTPTMTMTPTASPSSASAPMVVTISEVGSDVVMSASGTVDLSGLTLAQSDFGPIGGGGLGINTATFICGSNSSYGSTYSGFTSVPSNFGSGSGGGNNSASGDIFGIIYQGTPPHFLVVPTGYTSGANISSTQTFTGTTLSTLGLTNGTYTYTWSGGSIDVVVGGPAPTPTPTPSTGAVGAGWNFYDTAGTVITNPPLSDGQILMYTNAGGPPTSTYSPNNGTAQYVLIYKKNSAGTDYTTQFANLQSNGGTINITQNGNTATYVGSSGEFNFDPAGFLVIPTAIQTVTVASPFTFADTITITIS